MEGRGEIHLMIGFELEIYQQLSLADLGEVRSPHESERNESVYGHEISKN